MNNLFSRNLGAKSIKKRVAVLPASFGNATIFCQDQDVIHDLIHYHNITYMIIYIYIIMYVNVSMGMFENAVYDVLYPQNEHLIGKLTINWRYPISRQT